MHFKVGTGLARSAGRGLRADLKSAYFGDGFWTSTSWREESMVRPIAAGGFAAVENSTGCVLSGDALVLYRLLPWLLRPWLRLRRLETAE
ncbi:hypothetical protein Tdes44962_MAKER06097 [Teratosphaeria destructans]|uniref:Uncharacterized protein n=1 Tax=Teratosphaeria destructans TaxID=418781 RepID=A0A9W7VXS4_9PEZI|nr:hypothetical protein Tdes44962_MAKER06097 [Teratosphaeria destructans]